MKVQLKKLSLCPCGFPLLKTSILLGYEYEVNPDDCGPGTLVCGGCGNRLPVTLVWTKASSGGTAGYLPAEIFK